MRFRHLAVAVLATLASMLVPGLAQAHESNPHYVSEVNAIVPPVPGVSATIVGGDDSLRIVNRSGKNLKVPGYVGEPYVRIDGDGSVYVNVRSPAYTINERERDDDSALPAGVGARAQPQWRYVDKTGRYAFDDRRIHWNRDTLPPQVKDEHDKVLIDAWRVPFTVAGKRAAVTGTLEWRGEPAAGMPIGAIVVLVVAIVVLGGVALVVRRRRAG